MGGNRAATATLDNQGQFAIPPEISEATGIGPGQRVWLTAVGPGRFEVVAGEVVVADLDPMAVGGEIEPMTIADAFTHFVTDDPVDLRAIRQDWEDEAAGEVIEELARDACRSRGH